MKLKNFFSSFKIKIALGVVLVQLLTTAATLYVSMNFLKTYGEREIIQHARTAERLLATSAREAILVNDYALLDTLTKSLSDNEEILYARVKNETGSMIAKNGDEVVLRNHFVLDTGIDNISDGSFDTFLDMYADDYYIGRVEIGISTEGYNAFIKKAIRDLLLLTFLQICTTLIFAYFMAYFLTRQIYKIADVSKKIAAGELGVTIPISGSDDISKVAETFNNMSLYVKHNNTKLQDLLKDLEKAKKQAEEEEEKLRGILETVADAVVIMKQDGAITVFNPAAEAMFKQKKADMIGKSVALLMPYKVAKKHHSSISSFLKHKKTRGIGIITDIEGIRSDGTVFPVEAAVSASEINNEVFFTGVIRDVSERKKNEQELITAKQLAEEASKAKTAFMAVMSHEIRTPMNVIMGMVDILKNGEKDPSKQEKLESIGDAAENLMGILNDMLDLSKLDTNKMELENDNFNLREVLTATSDFFSYAAEEKGLSFKTNITKNIPENVWGDGHRLRQILSNLLGNALKFTSNGEINIKANAEQNDKNWILNVEISDTGIGINEENLEQIFNEFTQADQSMTRKYGGSGLGLAICKKLVEMMGGKIHAESTPGKGSCFIFNVVFSSTEPAEEKVETLTLSAVSPSILIAEDSLDNQELIKIYTKNLPIKVTFAEDGQEALDKYQKNSFHLVLMDRSMPVMGGDESAEAIRKIQEATGNIVPIFSFSANLPNEVNYPKELYDGHFSKPFKKKDIEDFLNQIFPNAVEQKEHLDINIDPELADLVPLYINRKSEEIMLMFEALEADDYEKIEFLAHSIKGTGKSYGFQTITDIGNFIEKSAKEKDKKSIKENIKALEIYVEKVKKVLM